MHFLLLLDLTSLHVVSSVTFSVYVWESIYILQLPQEIVLSNEFEWVLLCVGGYNARSQMKVSNGVKCNNRGGEILINGYYHFITWCKLEKNVWGHMLIVIQKGISIKMPMQTESYCAHLSIEPFKYLLDHHIAVEWEGIFKRSYYLKFKAVWMKWETIYSHAAWFLTVKREGGTGLGRVIIVHNFAERRINFWQKYYSMRYIPMHHNK